MKIRHDLIEIKAEYKNWKLIDNKAKDVDDSLILFTNYNFLNLMKKLRWFVVYVAKQKIESYPWWPGWFFGQQFLERKQKQESSKIYFRFFN